MQVGPFMRQAEGGRFFHWCPECKMAHALPSDTGRWTYNGNPDAPTFSPSFRQNLGLARGECHYIITDGNIHWCGDSWHGRSDTQPMVRLDDVSVDDGEKLAWLD